MVRAYYRALEEARPLAPFYATDAEAGALGPVVKIGTEAGESFSGHDAVASEMGRVSASLLQNRLESQGLVVRRRGDLAWFADQVWWSGQERGRPFASLTRWTGVCLRGPMGWRFLQLHVSEGV